MPGLTKWPAFIPNNDYTVLLQSKQNNYWAQARKKMHLPNRKKQQHLFAHIAMKNNNTIHAVNSQIHSIEVTLGFGHKILGYSAM